MTPDWIPNIHPFIVHFPVALLVIAILFDCFRLFISEFQWLNRSALLCYLTGTLGLVAAYISGQNAIDSVNISGDAIRIATLHEDWALYTLIFFILFTSIRFTSFVFHWETDWKVRSGVLVVALAGGGMLWYTGELGAKLVFKHGVAVGEIDRLQERIESLERDLAQFREETTPVQQADGSWSWRAGPGSDQIIRDEFTLVGGEDFRAATERDEAGNYLVIQPGQEKSFLLFGEDLRNIEGTVELNLNGYTGNVKLVHHYLDPDNYQYLLLENGTLSQGQVINGNDNVLLSENVNPDGWFTLRVSASGQHFYGYKNGQTITHTHADEMDPGLTGISIYGDGELKIRRIEFQSIE